VSKIGVYTSELGIIVIAEGERYGVPGYRYLPDPG
jgi:hypothetical protein